MQTPPQLAPITPGQRLDHTVAAAAGVSRRRAQKLIADGAVWLNGRATKAADKGKTLAADDRVEIAPSIDKIVHEPGLTIEVLQEGAGFVVVNKPAGMPVHPLRHGETGTVLNAIAVRYPKVQGVGSTGADGEGGLASGVVHRLDVDTSGALLVALDEDAWQKFRKAFAEHRVTKHYRALVQGQPDEQGRAELDLAVTRHRPAYVSVVEPEDAGARRCTLGWQVVERYADAALIDVQLETGFLHQVRVSMAHLGHPVLGDKVYGNALSQLCDAPRQMLHAGSLCVDEVDVQCPLPDDFAEVMGRLAVH